MDAYRVVKAEEAQLDAVRRLHASESKHLGFYPEGAFRQRMEAGQLLVACDASTGIIAGYAAYYPTGRLDRVIKLSHLCIESTHRGKGVARALVEAITQFEPSTVGIHLNCRRDYPASQLWPRLGFVAVDTKFGRSAAGHELTKWVKDFGSPSLFANLATKEEPRLRAVLDANVFYDLIDPTRHGAEESRALQADWMQDEVALNLTAEIRNEIERNPSRTEREARRRDANCYAFIDDHVGTWESELPRLKQLIGAPTTPQDAADRRQLARSVAGEADFFISRDQKMLAHAEAVYEATGLTVIGPAEFVARIDYLLREGEYQQRFLAESRVSVRRIAAAADAPLPMFTRQPGGVKRLRPLLTACLADPKSRACELVQDRGGEPLAIIGRHRRAGLVTVPVLRLANRLTGTRFGSTLALAVVATIVRDAAKEGDSVIRIEDAEQSDEVAQALTHRGFIASGGAWIKACLRGVHSIDEARKRLQLMADSAAVELSGVIALSDIDAADATAVLRVESLLFPAKLRSPAVASYVVPIQPRWAADLFDGKLAQNRLWEAEADLVLHPDSAYYRSPRKGRLAEGPGRLLWYVSKGEEQGFVGPADRMQVRGCSQMRGWEVGAVKAVFGRHRRFGVYSFDNVEETADQHGQVMAIDFTNTEELSSPLPHAKLCAMLDEAGVGHANMIAPLRISDDLFASIYRACTRQLTEGRQP